MGEEFYPPISPKWKTLETRMVPAFFAFPGCHFGMMEIEGICGKVGKKLVRELVKSFTNF